MAIFKILENWYKHRERFGLFIRNLILSRENMIIS
jgi:hypothetical protein